MKLSNHKKPVKSVIKQLRSLHRQKDFVGLEEASRKYLEYYENNPEIQNFLGYRGSIVSDFLFQSVGLVAYLIPFTLFFSSLNMLIYKKQIVIIDSLFFCILYIVFGSLFLSYFKDQSFFLVINGNGGFVGSFIKNTFLTSILEINISISYYFLILLTITSLSSFKLILL